MLRLEEKFLSTNKFDKKISYDEAKYFCNNNNMSLITAEWSNVFLVLSYILYLEESYNENLLRPKLLQFVGYHDIKFPIG